MMVVVSSYLLAGQLDQKLLESITDTEAALVAPAYGVATLIHLVGGQHQALKGHTHLNVMDVQQVQRSLPPRDIPFKVVVTSPLTPAQRVQALRSYGVDRDRVTRVLEFLRAHNPLFSAVTVDRDVLRSLPTNDFLPAAMATEVDDEKSDAESTSRKDASARSAQEDFTMASTVNIASSFRPSEGTGSSSSSSSSSSFSSASSVSIADLLRTVRVSPSTDFVPHSNKSWLALCFPLLFPFGTGHLATPRPVAVSPDACIAHYLRLSSSQFQSARFLLFAYDYVTRKSMARAAYVQGKVKIDSSSTIAERISALTPEQVELAAQYHEAKSTASRYGIVAPPAPTGLSEDASTLFKSLKAISKFAPHTQEAIAEARNNALALQYFYGQPTLWFVCVFAPVVLLCDSLCSCLRLTVAPDDNNNLVVEMFAKGHTSSTLPGRTFRFQLVRESPGATVLAFERVWSSLLKLFGWDVSRNCADANGGIFGVLEAYSVGWEEQARGALHGHVLLWVAGWAERFHELYELASNPGDESSVAFHELKTCILSYLDAVITTNPPLPAVDRLSVLYCSNADCKAKLRGCPDAYRLKMRSVFPGCVSISSVNGDAGFCVRSNTKEDDPHLVVCPDCAKGYGPASLLRSAVTTGFAREGNAMDMNDKDAFAAFKWARQVDMYVNLFVWCVLYPVCD